MLSAEKISEVLGQNSHLVVAENPKFDLESYIQNYDGATKLARLQFIGAHSVPLCVEALKGAILEARSRKNRGKYFESQQLLARLAPNEPEATPDHAWMEATKKQVDKQTMTLQSELGKYKNTLIRECIRLANEDLGKHLFLTGDTNAAWDAFVHARQDCSDANQIAKVYQQQIIMSLGRSDWANLQAIAQKLSFSLSSSEVQKKMQPYSRFVFGLAFLGQRRYPEAANAFLQAEPLPPAATYDIVTPNDVAVYGALLALATMDRNGLQRRVLDNSDFRTYLELESHLRKAITYFINGRYTLCLAILESYRNDFLLDIYLSAHVEELFDVIRQKSIIEYFLPFSFVTLDSLSQAFGVRGEPLEEELIRMIKSGKLNARIDLENKLLTAVPKVPRTDLQQEVLATAEHYEKEMHRRILRMNIIGANLEVKGTKKPEQSFSALAAIEHPSIDHQAMLLDNDSGYEL